MSTNEKFKLLVHVLRAKNLTAKDINGFSDPYCYVVLGDTRCRTKSVPKTLHPVWNEHFVLDVESMRGSLMIACWDQDLLKDDDYQGKVEFPLAAMELCPLQEGWYPLEGRRRRSEMVTGEIELRIELRKSGEGTEFDTVKYKEYLAGFLTKQGAKFKSWKKRWCVLDREKLTYSYPELDKNSKPIYQIYLSEVQRLSLETNMDFCFGLATTCKGNRKFLFHVENKKSLARWMLAIDGLKHSFSRRFDSSMDPVLKHELLASLYLEGFHQGEAKFFDGVSDDAVIAWEFDEGIVKCTLGPMKDAVMRWNAQKLEPMSPHKQVEGYGCFDGVRLAWYTPDGEQKQPFLYFCENAGSYINTTKETLNCGWMGNTLKVQQQERELEGSYTPTAYNLTSSFATLPVRQERKTNSKAKEKMWMVGGDFPEPCVMMCEIIRLLQYPEYVYNPSSSPWIRGKVKPV